MADKDTCYWPTKDDPMGHVDGREKLRRAEIECCAAKYLLAVERGIVDVEGCLRILERGREIFGAETWDECGQKVEADLRTLAESYGKKA